LDPDASGVLLVCLGGSTRVARYLMEGEKEYRATLRLGVRTDTADRTGNPVGPSRAVRVRAEQIREVCDRWVGDVQQVPPMVSAVKRNGVRLYKLARAGVSVERAPRRVRIHQIDVEDISLPFVTVRVRCGSGTYIRVLAEDIGDALGCGAHVLALRRTRVGVMDLDACVGWHGLERATGEDLASAVWSADRALAFLPALTVDRAESRRICTGQPIRQDRVKEAPAGWIRLRDEEGRLVAVGSVVDGEGPGMATVRPVRVLEPVG